MEQSSDELCGHDRDVLRLVLHVWSVPHLRTGTVLTKAQQRAYDDANDPAKLAEMLAERGRELGIDAVVLQCGTVPDPYPSAIIWHHADTLAIEVFPHHTGALTMPQARALLAAWLALPDGDRVGAEKALRGRQVTLAKLTIKTPVDFDATFRARAGKCPAHRVQALERVAERHELLKEVADEQAKVESEAKGRMARRPGQKQPMAKT